MYKKIILRLLGLIIIVINNKIWDRDADGSESDTEIILYI